LPQLIYIDNLEIKEKESVVVDLVKDINKEDQYIDLEDKVIKQMTVEEKQALEQFKNVKHINLSYCSLENLDQMPNLP